MKWPFSKGHTGSPRETQSASSARAQLLWKQGSKFLERRKYAKAIESLNEAYELEPSRLDGRLNLGAAYFLGGRPAEAIPHLKYVLALEPQNTAALLNLAAAFDGVGNLAESVAVLERLVGDRPHWNDAHYNLAVGYFKMERFDEAATALRAELTLNPRHEAARTLLNEVHLKPRRQRRVENAAEPENAASRGVSPPEVKPGRA